MSALFHQLFEAIATAPTEEVLRSRFMDAASEAFAVPRWGIYLVNEEGGLKSVDTVGVSEDFIDRYQQFGKPVDPVLSYVSQYHAPAHEALVLPQGTWRQSELYQRCCSQHNHAHIMTGPIVGQGKLIGTINFARLDENNPFGAEDDACPTQPLCTESTEVESGTESPFFTQD